MKIIHTSDWHLGPREFLDSTLANIERLCRIGDEREARVMIVAGDIFHNRQNLPEATRRVAEVLRPSIERGMHLVIVPGNHDDRAHLNMMAELLQIGGGPPRISIARKRFQIFEIEDPILGSVQFGTLPYPTPEQYLKSQDEIATAGEQNQGISAIMDGHARKLRAKFDPSRRAVFITHLNVTGVTTPSGHELEIWEDLRLGTESLPDENCVAYIALGHIHQNYPIEGHPIPAHYCGSIERTNLGERDDEKGALWVEIPPYGNASVERICLNENATPFYKISCAFEEIADLPAKYPRLDEAFANCTVTGATEAQRGQISRELRASCRQLLDCSSKAPNSRLCRPAWRLAKTKPVSSWIICANAWAIRRSGLNWSSARGAWLTRSSTLNLSITERNSRMKQALRTRDTSHVLRRIAGRGWCRDCEAVTTI